ncbi:hypothetical protein JTB14_021732 [Gonioctena quinquepunctata]|nr:hypothetical protein JTB14_021732 [Gonioctena quinquepunctata]
MVTSTDSQGGNGQKCIYCKALGHKIYKCTKFNSEPTSTRKDFISKERLCFNYFDKHLVSQCTRDRCRICLGKHNTLLHENKTTHISQEQRFNEEGPHQYRLILKCKDLLTLKLKDHISKAIHSQHLTSTQESPQVQTLTCTRTENGQQCCMISYTRNQVLLATARVILFSENGERIEVRALLDSAPQTTFVIRDTTKMLKAKILKVDLEVSGISQSETHVSEMVDLILESKRSNTHKERLSVTCGILNKITCELPQGSSQICYNSLQLPVPARTLDCYAISDEAGAAVASAVLQDVGIIHEEDNKSIIDKNKIRRARRNVKI